MQENTMNDWQPIETAPTDGSVILAGYWREEGWWSDLYDADPEEFVADDHGFSRGASPLTHWMHPPKPPAKPTPTKGE
jgi:hypothetical protein